MAAKLTQKYTLKVLDFTKHDILAPHGILDIFQDIAGKHSNTYNMSFDELLKQNKIWVLLKVKFKVIKNIPLYSKINVKTWPKPKGLVDFDRETIICDENDNILIKGLSKWVIIDSQTRKIIPAKHVEYTSLTSDDSEFDEKFDKLKDFDCSMATSYIQKVEFCDVDHNNHMNNAKYAVMILNALRLKSEEIIDTFQIDYVHESMLDDVLTISYIKEDKVYNIKATCDNKLIFLSKITLK